MDKFIGKRLDGRYEFQELIGVGGMANVYRAFDVAENKDVAIKILKEEYLDNQMADICTSLLRRKGILLLYLCLPSGQPRGHVCKQGPFKERNV